MSNKVLRPGVVALALIIGGLALQISAAGAIVLAVGAIVGFAIGSSKSEYALGMYMLALVVSVIATPVAGAIALVNLPVAVSWLVGFGLVGMTAFLSRDKTVD